MGWFGSDSGAVRGEPLETVVGQSASLNGHLKSDGGVRIDGAFEGVIEATGNVVVSEGARVVADITARNITVGGAIKGNIDGTGRLEILSTGEVYGDIMVGSVMIDEGGLFQGTSRMRGMEQRALKAPEDTGSSLSGDELDVEDHVGIVDISLEKPESHEGQKDAREPEIPVPDLDPDLDDIEPVIPDVETGKERSSRKGKSGRKGKK